MACVPGLPGALYAGLCSAPGGLVWRSISHGMFFHALIQQEALPLKRHCEPRHGRLLEVLQQSEPMRFVPPLA